jgi:hypothetical protein
MLRFGVVRPACASPKVFRCNEAGWGAVEGLIVAARRSGVGGDCRVDRRTTTASLAFERGRPR